MVAASASSAADARVRRVFHEIETELGFGMVPNLFRSMSNNPAALEAHWAMFKYTVLDGQLPRTLKEMVGVVVSSANRSEYVAKVLLHSLGVQGVGEAMLAVLADGDATGAELPMSAQAMLRFAQKAARDRFAIGVEDFEALDDAGFSPAEQMEIVGTVDLFQALNSYTDLMRVPVDFL